MTEALIPHTPKTKYLLLQMLTEYKGTCKLLTVLLLTFALVSAITSWYSQMEYLDIFAGLMLLGCVILWIQWWSVRYRIEKGWYLDNSREVADFLRWVERRKSRDAHPVA